MIPNNLKSIRKSCGLTQLQVADKLHLNCHDRISKWEHGTMYPHMVNLLKLSIVYGKKPEELYPELLRNLSQDMQTKPSSSVLPLSEATPGGSL